MFKLYTQAVFERGNTARFGGFRPKNALCCSKKFFPTEVLAEVKRAGWAVKVGYKVGYKVFAVVVYQALTRGNQLSSTQPAAALRSSLGGMDIWAMRRCLRARRVPSAGSASLVVPQTGYGQWSTRTCADVRRAASEPDCGSAETRAHACGGVYWLEQLSGDLLDKYTSACSKRYTNLLMEKPRF